MSSKPEPRAKPELPTEADTPKPSPVGRLQNFVAGFLLSGIPLFVYGSLSVEMTQGRSGSIGTGQLAIALAIPLLCGSLSLFWGQRVIRFLGNLLESANLPF